MEPCTYARVPWDADAIGGFRDGPECGREGVVESPHGPRCARHGPEAPAAPGRRVVAVGALVGDQIRVRARSGAGAIGIRRTVPPQERPEARRREFQGAMRLVAARVGPSRSD